MARWGVFQYRADSTQWAACKDCLKGHPAFVIGNGPLLPDDLSPLDPYFSIGCNRIIGARDLGCKEVPLRYDPTVLMWYDSCTCDAIRHQFPYTSCIKLTNHEINWHNEWNGLDCIGDLLHPGFDPPADPSQIPVTGSSGVSAALWAMSLGCAPVYLLGMSAAYIGGRSNFYGINQYHERGTLKQLQYLTKTLMERHEGRVFPILSQDVLNTICESAKAKFGSSREYYLNELARWHARVRPGELSAPTDRPDGVFVRCPHCRRQSRIAFGVDSDCTPVGGQQRLPRVRARD